MIVMIDADFLLTPRNKHFVQLYLSLPADSGVLKGLSSEVGEPGNTMRQFFMNANTV
jgi:hypothetical protein